MLLAASTSGVVAGAMPEAAVMPGEILVGMAMAGAILNGGRDRGWKDFRWNASVWSDNEEIRRAASEVFGAEGPTEDVRLAIASWCPSLALGFSVHLSASACCTQGCDAACEGKAIALPM